MKERGNNSTAIKKAAIEKGILLSHHSECENGRKSQSQRKICYEKPEFLTFNFIQGREECEISKEAWQGPVVVSW